MWEGGTTGGSCTVATAVRQWREEGEARRERASGSRRRKHRQGPAAQWRSDSESAGAHGAVANKEQVFAGRERLSEYEYIMLGR